MDSEETENLTGIAASDQAICVGHGFTPPMIIYIPIAHVIGMT